MTRRFRSPARSLACFAVPAIAVACLAGPGVSLRAQEAVSLDELMRRVGRYVAQYEREMTNVVAEERYVQQASGTGALAVRTMRSDVGIVLDPYAGWMTLRDVFEVDGRPVRDREDRIAQLLMQREANRNDPKVAEQIVKENSRFNLDPPDMRLPRTINVPLIALKFVRLDNQARSSFRIERRGTRDGEPTVLLSFRERAKPRIITSPDEADAQGTVLVQAATGEVLETELRIATGDTIAVLQTVYARRPPHPLRLPVSMKETYAITPPRQVARTLEGEATYSRFRTFGVVTSTNVEGNEP